MRVAALILACLAPLCAAQQPIDYQRDVRPILSDNCYECHGPDAAQRKAGLRLDVRSVATGVLESGSRAIVAGDALASALIARVRSADAEFRMPPPDSGKSPLTTAQIEVLTRWVDEGAAFREHWSFVPPTRGALPAVANPSWCRGPVDRFVLAALEREGAAPAPAATRERLIRRVTFDLTGIPPTLAEVDAFLADPTQRAYEDVVDRLLASPRFGEHRARYWLDAARYGDTHGFHLDNYRSIWPFRDWVIRAFNENKPFDEFTIEQLAGDLLPDATLEQQIATGFNRCNPTTAEGGLIEAEYFAIYAADRVETTSTVWLGLTVGCARCHDHKFDPISQRDFYRMFAFFNSIDEDGTDRNIAAPKPVIAAPTDEQRDRQRRLQDEVAGLAAAMAAPMPAVDARQSAWEQEQAGRIERSWTELTPTSALSRGGATLSLVEDNCVLATGASPANDVYEVVLRTDVGGIRAIRLEALANTESPGGGVGRASHNNIVLTGFSVEAAPAARPLETTAVELVRASADWNQPKFAIANAIDDDAASGWAIDNGDSVDRAAVFESAAPFGFDGGTVLRVRLGFESQYAEHTIGKLRLSVSSSVAVTPSRIGPWEVSSLVPAPDRTAAFALEPTSPQVNETAWTRREELVDDQVHMLPGKVGTTFLRRSIHAPSSRPMQVALGSDDGISVFLNGAVVYARDVARPVARDQDRVTLDLTQGDNDLVLAISNYGGGHGFFFRVVGEDVLGVPDALARALRQPVDARSQSQRAALRDHFRRRESPEWRQLAAERVELDGELAKLDQQIPRTLVMKERAERRPAHVLVRGKYDRPGELVTPGVPAALPPLPAGSNADRLALARWLVDPDHPLTARVAVNRFWQSLFGVGLVETADDFGSQGKWPSHPALLDWLAREFVESGWDVKRLFRTLVTSATYRQSACAAREAYAADPLNLRLARGPRFRLDAECVRDQALAIGGLLVEDIGGPSVKPYQPSGLWRAVAYTSSNTAKFVQDQGAKLYRRSLYTFWKRTSPPPTMQTLDAPSRESCRVRRARTNTPLQALALLNEVQFVEAARGFATRILREGGATTRARIEFAFRTVTARRPDATELRTLAAAFAEQHAEYEGSEAAARALIGYGDSAAEDDLDPRELAAWTAFANMLLNLDETVTKG